MRVQAVDRSCYDDLNGLTLLAHASRSFIIRSIQGLDRWPASERFFQDQLRRQEHQVRSVRGRPQPTIHQVPKALACSLRGGYSLHRDAPCRAPAPTGR
jgi:hypothetical protein